MTPHFWMKGEVFNILEQLSIISDLELVVLHMEALAKNIKCFPSTSSQGREDMDAKACDGDAPKFDRSGDEMTGSIFF